MTTKAQANGTNKNAHSAEHEEQPASGMHRVCEPATSELPRAASHSLAFSGEPPFAGGEANSKATAGDIVLQLLSHPNVLPLGRLHGERHLMSMLAASADDFAILEAALRGSHDLFDCELLARFASRCHQRAELGQALLRRIEEASQSATFERAKRAATGGAS
jgi:hypothetical protein